MALTNQQKSAIRRSQLNEMAKAMGFPTWRKLETFLKGKFLDGKLRAIKTADEKVIVGLQWKPMR